MKTILQWLNDNPGEWLDLGEFELIIYMNGTLGARMKGSGIMLGERKPTIRTLKRVLDAVDLETQKRHLTTWADNVGEKASA